MSDLHRLPLTNEDLARAEQAQARLRNTERARMEREAIERRMHAGLSPQLVRAAEGGDADEPRTEPLATVASAAPDSMAQIAKDAARQNDELKTRMQQLLSNFAGSKAGTGGSFSEHREFAPEDNINTPASPPRESAVMPARSAPPPPTPQAKPKPTRKTIPIDDDVRTARSLKNLKSEVEPDDVKPDKAMKELMKMCEKASLQARTNSIKANRDFAIALRRNMPLFLLSSQIDVGKLNVMVNAIIKMEESIPQKDGSEANDKLERHVKRIMEMIDTMPEEDTVDYRSNLKIDDGNTEAEE